ncbi:MAG: CHAT domain-containing protein [Leptolyngbyaceae cyanobacterium]
MEYQCDPETDCTAIQNLQKSVPRQAYNLLATVQQQTSRDNDPIVQSYALGYLGHLYELSGKTNESQRLTQEALTLTSRSNIVYQWQWQLGRLTNHPNTQESSLEYYKNAVENVKTVREDLLYVSPDARFDFRDRIEPPYRQYISFLLSSNSSSAHAKSTTDEIQDALLKEAQEVSDSLRVAELENFLACGLLEANSTDLLASIQEVADAEQHTAIIYPIIMDDRLEILTRLPGQVAQSKKLDQPKPQIEHNTFSWSADQAGIVDHKLKQFRKELERPYFSNEHGQPLAEEIYDWFIRPIEDVLAQNQIDTLVFVLDGAFRNVPMAALSDGEQFLVEKYAIAATFGDLKIPEDPRQKTFRLLAAGLSADPKSPQTKISEEESPPDIFGPLFFVDEEINKIKQKFPTIALQNSDFTKEQVQKNIRLSAHNVVHLATHGEFGFTRDQTYLLAAADNSITELDQPIETEKIDLNNFDTLLKTRNQMPLDLLVLSACETATGDDREVLGIAGLAIQSGARSTLATLWSISDASTAILMDKFYDQLLTGVSKAKALQQAQKYLLKAGDKPSKWAPYLLVGDWR